MIAAVVIGGTSLYGGQGNILRTIIGVIIIALIRNFLNLAAHRHLLAGLRDRGDHPRRRSCSDALQKRIGARLSRRSREDNAWTR